MNGLTTVTGAATGAALSAGATSKSSRRLVLHFDLNKTILMKDTSNNVNNSTLTVSMIMFDMLSRLAIFLLGFVGAGCSLRKQGSQRSGHLSPISYLNINHK